MDLDKAVDKIRDAVVGELKEEFREFRAAVTGELAGYRVAIESLTARQTGMESELRDIRHSIDQTNRRIDQTNERMDDMKSELTARIDQTRSDLTARIDETRAELKTEIAKNTERIDETNKRIDETRSDLTARIDETRSELKAEIAKNTERIDETNKRIDGLLMDVSEIKGDLNRALSEKMVVDDLVQRVSRLEARTA
ncbi:MAG: hypothetical protein U5L00_13785 [Desulfovermiculus sp.]|nr:hypothetical protein [Desulfovermiculus sp.]